MAGERDTDPALGLTAELLSFVATLETLPVPQPDAAPPPPLTRWQVAHTKAVLTKSPHLAQLRSTLCPATMNEAHFWHAYFELCGERIVPAAEAPPSPIVLLAPPGEQAAARAGALASDAAETLGELAVRTLAAQLSLAPSP